MGYWFVRFVITFVITCSGWYECLILMQGSVVSCDTELRIRESTVKQSISGLEEEIKCHSGEILPPTYIPLLRGDSVT